MIFSGSYDGEIAIYSRDAHGDYSLYRTISMRKFNPSSNMTCLCYQQKRNTLIIGTNAGEIFFIDIDKNKLVSKCDTRSGEIEKFVLFDQENLLLSFNKKTEIYGLYLPPHLKKFKPSCHLVSEQTHTKISCVTMGLNNKRCYIGF